jgi:F-type H+-transporting ATPase subunit a
MGFMEIQDISPDSVIFWQWRFIVINLTLVITWILMGMLTIGSWLVTRGISLEPPISRWQIVLEMIIGFMRDQIRQVSQEDPGRYLPFIGTLFLFIFTSNILAAIPIYVPPTASLSTTAALAITVFVAVPLYGIWDQGLFGYLKRYFEPTIFMFPFHVMGDFSRTLALAVRLFGNVMSGSKIVAILLIVVPFVFPVFMDVLGLLTGVIQAYIFSILATVYIASGTRGHGEEA